MKVNVKQKDIDNGIGGDDNKCAIALAVKRAFNKGVDTTDVSIYYDRHCCDNDRDEGELVLRVGVEYYDKNHIDKEDLPLLEEFISDYDTDGQSVSPIKFNIDTSTTTI